MNSVPSGQLRLLTYNIHKGIGGIDRRYSLDRIVEVIQHYSPDVAVLQEVDFGVPRSRGHRQVRMLSEALGMPHREYQANVRLKQGHYGNAILSRFPMTESTNLNLTVPPKKRRRALFAKLHIGIEDSTRTLLVCNTHLGLAGFERKIQIRRLLSSDMIRNIHHETPAIVAGDFNDVWMSIGRKLMFPAGFRCAVGGTKTFPAMMPVRSLDAIYYRGDLKLINSFAGRIEQARHASDHLPVITDFQIATRGVEQ
ncbi:MAG: endonuclease/exonuclease/phosphatase family protein [Pirellulaceae bacterium]